MKLLNLSSSLNLLLIICNFIIRPLRLNILNVLDSTGLYSYTKNFRLTHELETTQPNQLRITIYETSLDQSDTLQIQNDEFHIPIPTLTSNGVTFQIDPAIYDFRYRFFFVFF